MNIKLDFKDILIVPSEISNIDSRQDVFPYYQYNGGIHLPLIAAPMDTVVGAENAQYFIDNKINVCYPRGEVFLKYPEVNHPVMQFESISLQEFDEIVLRWNNIATFKNSGGKYYVCIDVANGHMEKLQKLIRRAKNQYKDNIVIMAGNIANPKTFSLLADAGADFIRCGIGNGNACITTQQLGVGYPMASLILECKIEAERISSKAKIVADGGMKDYSDILKALACGADYVMVGSIFNKALESCGDTYFKGIKINQYGDFAKWLFKNKFTLIKKFRGMSTKEVQKKWGRTILKTSEGIISERKVEYAIGTWIENFEDYLRSNMSYTNSKTLSDFSNSQLIKISENSYKRFNK